ncbi:hypothetical protein DQ04_02971030 [Trypanosoma grayi]|uniref:hypothetical protein n=1 Tax=Trypanosoma grayi TaxID=71804 RepID=UPI0004F422E7|nr:hypothetical protein DQ04_02971030 [Trypanosoma grayi]KEG11109.1 hypothetical protein DQ04_02971030 [Trypanosoma grayi]
MCEVAKAMQLNLPPPPLIHITFSGQPAVSTGVVNLAALLGNTEYLLVRVLPTGDRVREEDGYIDSDDGVNDGIYNNGSSNGAVSTQRWQRLQLCEHAGLPLGCFAVEDGGSYEVVRRGDVRFSSTEAVVKDEAAVPAEAVAAPRKQKKRDKKRKRREETEEMLKTNAKPRRQSDRKVTEAATSEEVEQHNEGTEEVNGGGATSGVVRLQRVHLETPATQTLMEEEEQQQQERERRSVSPPLVASHLPIMEAKKRRRPLNNSSSCGSSRSRDEQQQQQQAKHHSRDEYTKETQHGMENARAMEPNRSETPTPPRRTASSSTTNDEAHASRVAGAARVTKASPVAAQDNGVGSPQQDVLRNGAMPLLPPPEAEEDAQAEVESRDSSSSYRPSNGIHGTWVPQESPALGFTSVDNTLSQDFSLGSSSVTSSADYVY